ncbi:hypothetical protein VaNZ11_012566 [Volvox africanus]|uniref:Guanylate cyclase domain-containing protein n=1 Tax=Volvox africanus TaxID=51714 RepID=A0ABQ5SE76_9CHLO|nr:hypothetical protein VaNZ11_012566 [Volvox africanus]
MKDFLACLLGCSKWSLNAGDPDSEETPTDGDGNSKSGHYSAFRCLGSRPSRGGAPAPATESAAGTKEQLPAAPAPPPFPSIQEVLLPPSFDQLLLNHSSTALLDSLIVAVTPACISIINLSGKMLHQNPQSRAYYGDRVGGSSSGSRAIISPHAEGIFANEAAAAGGTSAAAAGCGCCISNCQSIEAEADVLEQLFFLDPEKKESMRLMLRTTSSGGQAGVWKAVVRVPHSLTTGKSVLTPAPRPLPTATSPTAADGTAQQPSAQPQITLVMAEDPRTAASLRCREAAPQPPVQASWVATAPRRSSYPLAGIQSAAGLTMSIKYSQGSDRRLSQTNEKGTGFSCNGSSSAKTEGGVVDSRLCGAGAAAMDSDSGVNGCVNISGHLPPPSGSVQQTSSQGRLLANVCGRGSSTAGMGPLPKRMAAPLPRHHTSTPQTQIAHHLNRMLEPTLSASFDAGPKSSGCLTVDPLATSTFSTLVAVPVVLTPPQRTSFSQRPSSSHLPSCSRTAPAQTTSTTIRAAPNRISIDDPLYPTNRAHVRRRALTTAASCVETGSVGIGSLWDLPRTTISFRIRETLCTQLHKTSKGVRVPADDEGDGWDVTAAPQQERLLQLPSEQLQQPQSQTQQLKQPPQQRQLRSHTAVCTSRAFAFALSLGTSPLGPQSASSGGGAFSHTSVPLLTQKKQDQQQQQEQDQQQQQEQEQERGDVHLAQHQEQHPAQQREKRQQQMGVWLARHEPYIRGFTTPHSAAAGASRTTVTASSERPCQKMSFAGINGAAVGDSSERVKSADVSISPTLPALPAAISATRTPATTGTLITRDTADESNGTGVDGEFMYTYNSQQDNPLLLTTQEPDPGGSGAASHQQSWSPAPIVKKCNASSTILQQLLDSEIQRPATDVGSSSLQMTQKRFLNQKEDDPPTLFRLINDAAATAAAATATAAAAAATATAAAATAAATAATTATTHADTEAEADDAKPPVSLRHQVAGVAAADSAGNCAHRWESVQNPHPSPTSPSGMYGFCCSLLEPPGDPQPTDLQSPQHPLGTAQRWKGECWHEVWVMPAKSPLTGESIIIITQIDVTAKVIAERHLAMVMETEHRLVEQLFPRHILQCITEDWTAAGTAAEMEAAAAVEGQTPLAPAGDAAVRRQSNFGPQEQQLWGSERWQPAIRNCTALATSHSEVTLLFADIKGFTPMCKEVEPRQTMTLLNELYSRYDALLDKYGVYKVETIGDCYFVAGGLMREDEDGMTAVCDRSSKGDPLHAERVLAFAKAMLMAARQVLMPTSGQPVEVRVGLHTGPVVSGVVGTRMPRFCLFGDTVNTASRMESTGVPGAIHASEATFRRLPRTEQAEWKPTGGIQVKGKGLMQTYLWMASAAEGSLLESAVSQAQT